MQDGQRLIIYDALGNVEVVEIAKVKMEKYNETKHLLEINYGGQVKQMRLIQDEDTSYEEEILHAICNEKVEYVDFK